MCIGWLFPGIFILINVIYLYLQHSGKDSNSCWSNQDQFSKMITNGNDFHFKIKNI